MDYKRRGILASEELWVHMTHTVSSLAVKLYTVVVFSFCVVVCLSSLKVMGVASPGTMDLTKNGRSWV